MAYAESPDNMTMQTVDASTSSVKLVGSANTRQEVIVTNNSTARLFLSVGVAASSTTFIVVLEQYESFFNDTWNGELYGYWEAATGKAHVVEVLGG